MQQTAVLEPGVLFSDLIAAGVPYNLMYPGPHTTSVGITGFAIADGDGFAARSMGGSGTLVKSYSVVDIWSEGDPKVGRMSLQFSCLGA